MALQIAGNGISVHAMYIYVYIMPLIYLLDRDIYSTAVHRNTVTVLLWHSNLVVWTASLSLHQRRSFSAQHAFE